MEAPAVRRWGYVGSCCAALALIGCPQLLGDDFLVSRDIDLPDTGLTGGTGGQGDAGAAGQGGSAAGGTDRPDAGLGGASGAGGDDSNAPSCSDGVRNQDETGIDCGGVCPACCQFGPFHDVVQVDGLGTDDRFGPALSADGAWIYFSVSPDNDVEDLFRAQRKDKGTVFSGMQEVPNVNGSTLDGSPFLSDDDRTLYFFSDRLGGAGSRDLWMATRASDNGEFSAPEPVPNVNSSAMDLLPRLSPDGLSLLFESTRGGNGADIWAAERATATASFGAPHLRTDLSTSSRDEGVTFTRDQLTIVLASSRGGDMDLWTATRPTANAEFGSFEPVSELNSSDDEFDPALSRDGREIFFVTTRNSDARIYHAQRDCQ